MAEPGGHRKVSHSLVALGSAAVVAVYAAGYERTRPAADRLAQQSAERRPAIVARAAPAAPAAEPRDAPALLTAPVAGTPAVPAPAAPPDAPRAERRTAARKIRIDAPPVRSADVPSVAAAVAPPSIAAAESAPAPVVASPVAPAPAAAEPTPVVAAVAAAPAPAAASQYKDGTYSGWGSCRHGTIEATVVIAAGRIESARISQCRTRYSCSWIDALPGQVVTRQSPEVDYVSGATQSVDAFYYAVVEALSKAK